MRTPKARFQVPSSKLPEANAIARVLKLGIENVLGTWNLEFGIFKTP